MPAIDVPLKRLTYGATSRRDLWWVQPLLVFLGLSSFVVYATYRAFSGEHYFFGNYLSPFASPMLFGDGPHAIFGAKPDWIPAWLPFTPALLILPAPAGFRLTCYYYRGAYYKAFWQDPPACAVGEPRSGYRGENSFPLILQNIHRYFLYLAVIFIFLLAHDAWKGMWFGEEGHQTFGLGLGSLVLIMNVTLLGSYTFGCHSLRHLVGGVKDILSGNRARKATYDCVTCLNRYHQTFAWCSLFGVMATDLYVTLCSRGVITDLRIF